MANRSEIDGAYADAVALADRARSWFDGAGKAWRGSLPVEAQAQVAVETLVVTARLLAAVSWLLDPAHQDDDRSPPPFRADVGGAIPVVLDDTEGGRIAADTRALVARLNAIASRPVPPVLTATYGAIWRA